MATFFAVPGAWAQEPSEAEQRPEAVYHGSRHAVAIEGNAPHPSRPHDVTERASIYSLDTETISSRRLPSVPLRTADALWRWLGGVARHSSAFPE
eukprot:1510435-Prymnesium_polylepis.2